MLFFLRIFKNIFKNKKKKEKIPFNMKNYSRNDLNHISCLQTFQVYRIRVKKQPNDSGTD